MVEYKGNVEAIRSFLKPLFMTETRFHTFVLYNSKEERIKDIISNLEKRGVKTFYSHRDVLFNDKYSEITTKNYNIAPSVLVLLGNAGWGLTQRRIVLDAQQNKKKILFALCGDPPEEAFSQANNMIGVHTRFDLRNATDETYIKIAHSIIDAASLPSASDSSQTGRLEPIITALLNGTEAQQKDTLQYIKRSKSLDRSQLSVQLRSELSKLPALKPNSYETSKRTPLLRALVFTNSEDQTNRTLIFDNLDQSLISPYECYVVIGDLYAHGVKYTTKPKTRATSEFQVRLLVEAIDNPSDQVLIDKFRSILRTDNFHEVNSVLYTLGIVAIPDLAADVCTLISQSHKYFFQALVALSNSIMAKEAVKTLSQNPGLKGVIDLILKATPPSPLQVDSTRVFAGLLASFNEQEVDRLLQEFINDPKTHESSALLRKHLLEIRRSDDKNSLFVAGYASDLIDVRADPLDIKEDVQTLTAVMLAKDVKPPLAIGLFGKWGSGKSFFMQSMRAAAESLAKKSENDPNSAFCSNIVSIRFNAWYYIDTNLWASLVSYILEQLAAYVTPKPTPEEQQAALLKELGSTKTIVTQAQSEITKAHQQISTKQDEIQRVQTERLNKEVELKDLRFPDLVKLLLPGQKKELDQSLKEIGIPTALTSINDLNQVVTEGYSLRGRITALFFSIINSKDRSILVGILLFLLVVLPLISWLAHRYLDVNAIIAAVTAFVTETIIGILVATKVLSKAFSKVEAVYRKVDDAKNHVQAVLAEKRKNPTDEEKNLEKEIAQLSAQEQEAILRLSAANARIVELEERIRSIEEGRSLSRFLAERTSSDDYKKHMGLISTIRQDFESLADRLSKKQTPGEGMRPVDRIILYIDDLDRCPTSKVMDVLQAVHLLLAYKLFVVVVGVDPRWLVHSLVTNLSAFGAETNQKSADSELLYTTPQNYLEKIFQIPFSLRPMTDTGYGKLMASLLLPVAMKEFGPPEQNAEEPPKLNKVQKGLHTEIVANSLEGGAKETSGPGPTSNASSDAAFGSDKQTEDFEIYEDALTIKPWEASFAQKLFAFIPTPRAAKRFSNVYRILKAPVKVEQIHQFEGTEYFPGDFQVPMLLLSILIGSSNEAALLFPKFQQHLIDKRSVVDALTSFDTLGLSSPALTELQKKIQPIVSDPLFPDSFDVFLEWIPRVSRFSFELGRVIQPVSLAGEKKEHIKSFTLTA